MQAATILLVRRQRCCGSPGLQRMQGSRQSLPSRRPISRLGRASIHRQGCERIWHSSQQRRLSRSASSVLVAPVGGLMQTRLLAFPGLPAFMPSATFTRPSRTRLSVLVRQQVSQHAKFRRSKQYDRQHREPGDCPRAEPILQEQAVLQKRIARDGCRDEARQA